MLSWGRQLGGSRPQLAKRVTTRRPTLSHSRRAWSIPNRCSSFTRSFRVGSANELRGEPLWRMM